jgi:hypothetical protein
VEVVCTGPDFKKEKETSDEKDLFLFFPFFLKQNCKCSFAAQFTTAATTISMT